MKKIGIILVVVGLLFAILRGIFHFYVNYQYENEIQSYWEMSDRASTISQKSEYLDKFVLALSKQNLDGTHDAIFYHTAKNSFTENMKALKSLQRRLHQITTMDENSFAYQTAIQQITEQEQGEALEMLHVFVRCWEKENHYTTWNIFVVFGFFIIQFLMIVFGIAIINQNPYL
ncbi:hypothetical protein COY27_07110 [Candidatus Woesearchaeota archaeon CG_4_10_14_0_2_um_filter_33_13]|nr:MAG: hypothetical protein COY27_07110 [Candidatus Woesearchaeota archaeon CG_4_10_14_0_2_um_filter_33_13]